MTITLAVTMGDPCGIGPEVIAKAFRRSKQKNSNFLIVAAKDVLFRYGFRERPGLTVYDPHVKGLKPFVAGRPSADSGKLAFECLRKGLGLVLSGRAKGLITAPVSKEALCLAGFRWPGHTEFLAEASGAKQIEMVFVSDKLKVALVTRHMSLEQAIDNVKKDRIVKCGMLVHKMMREQFRIKKPRIAVCGLNPHAGESGMFGEQDAAEIAPAVKSLNRTCGRSFWGPLAADGVFHRAYEGAFDMVMCMYHDQGLIPFKMTEFSRGVHFTAGLPFVRTSPVHGTAFDIAGKNKADEGSMLEAIKLACCLAK